MTSGEGGIDEELVARAIAEAKARGESIDAVIERALRAYVEGRGEIASQGE